MALADRVSSLPIPGRVAQPENWHLTLRFLGQIEEVSYDRFLAGLAAVEEVRPFSITLDRFGGFPKVGKASVVWAGVGDGEEQMTRLNEIAEEASQASGLQPEERPYHPHLTLARVRPPDDIRHLTEESLALRWTNSEVVVYRSHLGRQGARYEPLESFALSR